MSTTELPPEVQAPDPAAPKTWKDEFEQQWLQLKLGYEGFMLDKIQKQQASVLKLAEQAKTGKFDSDPAAGDDMGVSIGNKAVHYHMASTNTSSTDSSKPSTLGTVGKYAALAALMAGSGIGGSALYDWLNQAPAVVPDPTAYTNDGEIFEIK